MFIYINHLSSFMQVSQLRPRGKVDEITVRVLKLLQDRRVRSRYSDRELWLQEFRVSDGTGEADLLLWEDDCGKVMPSDLVRVTNGYCLPRKGPVKFTPGKYGSMEVL